MHVVLMMLQIQGALNIKMLVLGCCFPPYENFCLCACSWGSL